MADSYFFLPPQSPVPMILALHLAAAVGKSNSKVVISGGSKRAATATTLSSKPSSSSALHRRPTTPKRATSSAAVTQPRCHHRDPTTSASVSNRPQKAEMEEASPSAASTTTTPAVPPRALTKPIPPLAAAMHALYCAGGTPHSDTVLKNHGDFQGDVTVRTIHANTDRYTSEKFWKCFHPELDDLSIYDVTSFMSTRPLSLSSLCSSASSATSSTYSEYLIISTFNRLVPIFALEHFTLKMKFIKYLELAPLLIEEKRKKEDDDVPDTHFSQGITTLGDRRTIVVALDDRFVEIDGESMTVVCEHMFPVKSIRRKEDEEFIDEEELLALDQKRTMDDIYQRQMHYKPVDPHRKHINNILCMRTMRDGKTVVASEYNTGVLIIDMCGDSSSSSIYSSVGNSFPLCCNEPLVPPTTKKTASAKVAALEKNANATTRGGGGEREREETKKRKMHSRIKPIFKKRFRFPCCQLSLSPTEKYLAITCETSIVYILSMRLESADDIVLQFPVTDPDEKLPVDKGFGPTYKKCTGVLWGKDDRILVTDSDDAPERPESRFPPLLDVSAGTATAVEHDFSVASLGVAYATHTLYGRARGIVVGRYTGDVTVLK